MPTIERPDPPYVQIAKHIQGEILAGHLKDGDPVPSARKIMSTWNVAMATAAKALATLRADGLIRSKPGVGSVVQSKGSLHHSARDRVVSIHRTGKIYPPGHYAKIRSAELVPAPEMVADALGIEAGAPAVRRQRTTFTAEDTPVSTSVSWFTSEFARQAPLLLETGRIVQGTAKYVEERTGHAVAATYVQHAAGLASEEEAGELGIDVSSAVLMSRNRFLDAEGVVIEYGESTALPGHWVFYEYTNEER
ncbi:GntR family transcriptional regulator [Saccharopolyspora sp. ASAGF58]|uniref:GntR family transcriptional regulator n=1 Tax=Saccharopolyspora sp. ASAGF58 TaxID=2719023 RepID=UPI00143FDF7F|nr:GntR family transcriptional regulator [Saccharopolyspora sp. ASAGF58]QIZ36129.1 GntR family transcriptional regulator [Saccharopolyspora sp. ASAGF58]